MQKFRFIDTKSHKNGSIPSRLHHKVSQYERRSNLLRGKKKANEKTPREHSEQGSVVDGLDPYEDSETERETHTHTEQGTSPRPRLQGHTGFSGSTSSARGATGQTYTHARLFVEHGRDGDRPAPVHSGGGGGVGYR